MTVSSPSNPPAFSCSALILAAGRSSRMGSLKPLLPLGDHTLIERAVQLFRGIGISRIVVVLGHEKEKILPVMDRLGVEPVINPRSNEGMFSSIQAGVRRLDHSCRAFFLLPADIPLVGVGTLQALWEAFQIGDAKVCRPVFQGRHGHPPLISSELIPAICDFGGQGGLRTLLARYRNLTREIEVNDPGILLDLNTREDYESALRIIEAAPDSLSQPFRPHPLPDRSR